MSAAQPKANEPSMEEILASIRRIISDDQPAKPAAAAPAAPQPAAVAPTPPPAPKSVVETRSVAPAAVPPKVEDDEDILDLTPKSRAGRKQEPHFLTDDPVDNDLSFADPKSFAPPAPPPAPVEAPKGQDDIDALMAAAEFDPAPAPMLQAAATAVVQERLVSAHTDRAVSTAFSSLANTVLQNNGRTLDDVVTDMLRPMIKDWLDDNLPGIVERLVRAEIERVARGGR